MRLDIRRDTNVVDSNTLDDVKLTSRSPGGVSGGLGKKEAGQSDEVRVGPVGCRLRGARRSGVVREPIGLAAHCSSKTCVWLPERGGAPPGLCVTEVPLSGSDPNRDEAQGRHVVVILPVFPCEISYCARHRSPHVDALC